MAGKGSRLQEQRRLTLPSSGPPPAWPAPLLLVYVPLRGPSFRRPLMSNVRPHRTHGVAKRRLRFTPSAFEGAAMHKRGHDLFVSRELTAASRKAATWASNKHCGSCAGRPSCGGLLTSGAARTTPAFLEQAAPFKCTTPLRSVAALRHSQSNAVRYGRPTLKPSLNATSPMCSCSSNRGVGCAGFGQPAPLSHQASPPPNPSIERTCPGVPGHAAHVKR